MLLERTQRTVVQALVTSRLDYGNILYLGTNKEVTRRLQMVQNSAARFLCQAPRATSVSGHLRDLHWLRVENQMKFKALSYVFKIKTGVAPQYLQSLVYPYMPSRCLRSSTQGNFSVPRVRLSRMGGRSFAYLGPSLWNSLPISIQNETVYGQFHKSLKTWLFNQ